VWFIVGFLEDGCGVKVVVGVDHGRGELMVQFRARRDW
jgi:hypothetical protein